MKRIFITILFFALNATACLSAPNYDPNYKTVEYDCTYNINLRNKLEDNFNKKYLVSIIKYPNGDIEIICNEPAAAYGEEVVQMYDLLKKDSLDKI